ncbi:hypothetical protein RMCBS344292_02008 [Rhizopus microsporus]|nr:hypothetical protein RMCBS344292_02008 [Rhizopus microsporus]
MLSAEYNNRYVDKVYMGESLLSVKKIEEKFVCPVSDKSISTTGGPKSHLTEHTLAMRLKDIRDYTSQETHEQMEVLEDEGEYFIEDHSLPPYEIIQHTPPAALYIDNASSPQKKRKLLTHLQVTLTSSDSVTVDAQTKEDKLLFTELGQ